MPIIEERYFRLKCDCCGERVGPTADSKPEAKDLAKHIGWIIVGDKSWCVECFYKLDADKRLDLRLEAYKEK